MVVVDGMPSLERILVGGSILIPPLLLLQLLRKSSFVCIRSGGLKMMLMVTVTCGKRTEISLLNEGMPTKVNFVRSISS